MDATKLMAFFVLSLLGFNNAHALAPLSNVSKISLGAYHSCALTTTGGVKCWGRIDGQVVDNIHVDHTTPVDIVGLGSGVLAIAAGGHHTCVLTTAGGVKCWGNNYYGQLGDNSTTGALSGTMVDVTGLASGVAAIAAGSDHTCALTTAGGVKCWGHFSGLGNNSYTSSSTPVDVVGLASGVAAIAAGGNHTCALTTTGGVKCWGSGYAGYANGGGNNGNELTPVDVNGLTSGVTNIAAGPGHTCVLTTAGGVKCWGMNPYGQLGDNSVMPRSTPVNVVGLASGVTSIATSGHPSYHEGENFTCALTSAGTVKCWGYNSYGQLGDNTNTRRLTPVDVLDTTAPTASPDLVVSSLTAPSAGTIGGQITISATVANQGSASAGAYRLGFYYSTDPTITTADTFAGTSCNMSALATGDSKSCTGPVTVPDTLPPGNYYFGAIADDIATVSESNEGNNTRATPLTLGATVPYVTRTLSETKASSANIYNNFGPGESSIVNDAYNTHLLYAPEDLTFTEAMGNVGKDPLQSTFTGQPLGSRIPIILVHGWQGVTADAVTNMDYAQSAELYWQNLLAYFDEASRKSMYKLYVYKYPSYKHVTFNAELLKSMIDEHPELTGRSDFIFIAHSMGSIVTRSLFEEWNFDHARARKIITLDGVHHGSPAAVPGWVYGNTLPKDLLTLGANDIQWDGYDAIFASQNVGLNALSNVYGSLFVGWSNVNTDVTQDFSVLLGNFYRSDTFGTRIPESKSFDDYYRNKINALGNSKRILPVYDASDTAEYAYFVPSGLTLGGTNIPLTLNPWLLYLNLKHAAMPDAYKDKLYLYGAINANGNSLLSANPNNRVNDSSFTKNGFGFDLAEDGVQRLGNLGDGSGHYYGYLNDGPVPITSQLLDMQLGFDEWIPLSAPNAGGSTVITMYGGWVDSGTGSVVKWQPGVDGYQGDGHVKHRVFMDYHHDRMLNGCYRYDAADLSNSSNVKSCWITSADFWPYVESASDNTLTRSMSPIPYDLAAQDPGIMYEPLYLSIERDIVLPGTPTINTVAAYNGGADISFTLVASPVGQTLYTATCTAAGQATKTATGNGPSLLVPGLSNGVTYSCSVTATNSEGTGPASVVSFQAPACTHSISPTSQSASASGLTGTVNVSSNCAWTATSSADWITVTSGSSGSGNGTVVYSMAANTGTSARTGTLTIAGKTFTVSQSGASGGTTTNLLLNPGFESGASSWSRNSSMGNALVGNVANYAHTGSYFAYLGGYVDTTESIYQNITLPDNVQTAMVQFWHWITTEETDAYIYDKMTVELYSVASGSKLATLKTLSNLDATTGWLQSAQFDISAYKGLAVQLKFTATNDALFGTIFFIDDVTLTVTTTACKATLNTTAQSANAVAIAGAVNVSSNCAWTAASNASWIAVTSGAAGSGSGIVAYSVTSNTSTSPRTGTITIADQTFTITQAGAVAPDAPTLTAATASNSSVTLGFTPAATGVAATSYTGTCSAAGYTTRTGYSTGSPVVVNRLNSGVSYSCTVSATNSAGTGAESAPLGVTPTDIASANTVLHMPWFTKAGGYISRFVLLNTGPTSASYTITVLSEDGNTLALNASVASGTVGARQQAVINVDDLIQSFSAGQRAMAIITSDAAAGTLSGIYNLVQPSTGAISNVSLLGGTDFTSGSSTLFAPWFSTNTAYSSQFILSNAGNTDAAATPSFLTPSGTTATPKIGLLTIPAQGQVVINTDDLVTLSGGASGAVAFAVNAPEGRIKGTYKIRNLASGTASSTELINPETTVAFATRLVAPWFSTSSGYSSNFILTNRGISAAGYTVTVQTETGNTASTGTLGGSIPANGQVIIPASQIVTDFGSASRASAYFDVAGSPGEIDGVYQILSDSTGSVSSTLMAHGDTTGNATTTLRLPWLSGAGGYISRFILVNRGAAAAPFTIEILPEAGNAVTQILTSGTIPANGQLVLPVSSVISGFSGASRAAAIFTVSAPAADIDGLYNIVNPASGAISNTMMEK